MAEPIVIVGAGQAGQKAAETLRQLGHGGDVVLIGEEAHLPYQRPPLSKAYLKGEMEAERLQLRPAGWFDSAGIDLRLGTRAVSIDPTGRRVTLADGASLGFSALLLATGTRARRVPLPGADLDGVATLRTIADVDRIRSRMEGAERVAILGGGYIGMEFAAVACGLGKAVTVLEARARIMERVVAPDISAFFTALHRERGVDLRLGTGVAGLTGADGRVTGVSLADGGLVAADLVLLAVGAEPVTELAGAAGIAIADGIAVDGTGRTSAPGVFAAGDCASFPSPRYGRRIRLESVQNAIDHAKATAAAMLGADVPAYDAVPWFWSDQYDVKLQIAGLSAGWDATEMDGDTAGGRFSLRYMKAGRLLAVDSVNDPRSHMLARKALANA